MSKTGTMSVNVREILRSKAPGKKYPGFIVRFLEKIIHQDEVNYILGEYGNLYGTDFLEEIIKYFGIELEITGLEKLPEGRFTFACNHPMGGMDGICTGLAVYHRFPGNGITFLSNDILANIKNLEPLFIPVNRVGKHAQSRELPELLNAVYQSDTQMVLFPSGVCARRIKGKITEVGWTKSFIQKSIDSKRDIVPVYFEGRNSNFFYNLANIRKAFGIKTNIEMLFLADEMFRQKGKKFRVVFGSPISYDTFDKSKSHAEWAAWVRLQSLELSDSLKQNR